MTTKETGNMGETTAAAYLRSNGYEVLERNFKTPRCEIDIIARKGRCLYFVEVKYRQSERQGSGFDYITSRKLEHMQRAAELWLQTHQWKGEVTLSAVEVGAGYEVTDFIESLA